jgi:hypothetical protein
MFLFSFHFLAYKIASQLELKTGCTWFAWWPLIKCEEYIWLDGQRAKQLLKHGNVTTNFIVFFRIKTIHLDFEKGIVLLFIWTMQILIGTPLLQVKRNGEQWNCWMPAEPYCIRLRSGKWCCPSIFSSGASYNSSI